MISSRHSETLNVCRARTVRGVSMLLWMLPMLALAADPAGFEPVPATLLRGDVLVASAGGFQIGVAGLHLQWSTAARNGRTLYHGTDSAARRFYLVDCLPRAADATMEQVTKGAFDGMKDWANRSNADIQRTSSIRSDVPLANSTRILSQGRLADGKPFYAVRVLAISDTSLFIFTTYAQSQADLQDFDRLVGSFRLIKN